MNVHSILPPPLTEAADAVLADAGLAHVAHGVDDPFPAAARAAHDEEAIALIGPLRSADIAEAVEVTAPAGLPLLAPVATWAGVTRDDEPGCDDPARHRGTVLRMVARDTVVAERIAADVRSADRRAYVVAGDHDYGRQIAGQLRLADLPRVDDASEADLVVFAGFPGQPEADEAAALAPLPLVAFDGAQGAALGDRRAVHIALVYDPGERTGVAETRRAAELVAAAIQDGATDRATLLGHLRERGGFDDHGDPVDPPVWLWRADADWRLERERAI